MEAHTKVAVEGLSSACCVMEDESQRLGLCPCSLMECEQIQLNARVQSNLKTSCGLNEILLAKIFFPPLLHEPFLFYTVVQELNCLHLKNFFYGMATAM